MGTYLMLWKFNTKLISINPGERAKGYELLLDIVRKDIECGLVKSWGMFVGERSGYCLVEGSEVDVFKMTQAYTPFVGFSTHPVATLDNIAEVIKSLRV